MTTISGTAGGMSFFLKKFYWATRRFSRFAWRVNDVVHRKTVAVRKDLQSFSQQSRMPVTLVTMNSVSGSAISILNPSLQTKLTDSYAAVGNIEPNTSHTLHLKTTGLLPRSTVPALTRSTPPALKHTINVVANCVSGIHAVQSLH
jgi:hypothetical protein